MSNKVGLLFQRPLNVVAPRVIYMGGMHRGVGFLFICEGDSNSQLFIGVQG